MAPGLKLGVRELVEFCCRSGDLGGDAGPGVKALQGQMIHQKIQRRYRAQAESEVGVSLTQRVGELEVELGGRIDLLFADEAPPRIEEIKTVYGFRPGLEQDSLHWAQLKCYGACYARAHGLERVYLSLNLVELAGREERRHGRVYARDELERFVADTLESYLRWYRLVESQRSHSREQTRAMRFPFSGFRDQQKRFAAEVYRGARAGRQLIVEAPTGSGKTISTLFPALKALGDSLCAQIVYLSAKVSGQRQALETLALMRVDISWLVIQAKARSCVCNFDEGAVDADGRCRRCIGFFERLPAAREKLLRLRRLDPDTLQQVANEFELCPFELGLQMLPWVDVVICDFNYVFDPLVQLSYFKTDPRRKLLLIDELHNLVERARGMYSASLARRQIKSARAAANSRGIASALRSIQRSLDQSLRARDADESVDEQLPTDLQGACQRFGERLGYDIFNNKHVAAETLDFSRQVFRFQHISQLYGRHHRSFFYKPVEVRELRLGCLNAFEYLRACFPMFHALCGFSATLSPPDYFREALGLDTDCASLRLDSAFPERNLAVRVGSHIDTRYREREAQIDPICDAVAACYRARPGNYLVFFSAYYFMRQVHRRFVERYGDIDTLLQQREFDEHSQQQFVAKFFDGNRQMGFAIMGGRFAEGIDYRGEALIGAIIVGVGLPRANREQQLIQQDFEALGLDGFDYAFRFPGLIRVKQSAGRVIRDDNDRGVVVLLERRFREPGYARHLPTYWQPRYCIGADSLEQSLAEFWNDTEASHGTD